MSVGDTYKPRQPAFKDPDPNPYSSRQRRDAPDSGPVSGGLFGGAPDRDKAAARKAQYLKELGKLVPHDGLIKGSPSHVDEQVEARRRKMEEEKKRTQMEDAKVSKPFSPWSWNTKAMLFAAERGRIQRL